MIDYIIVGIIVFSIIVSLLRGFVREVMSLASWIVAFLIASNFYMYLAGLLTSIESLYIRNGTAIAILFVLSLIVGAIVNYVIGQLVDRTGLSGTDRVLGACGINCRRHLIFLRYFHQFEPNRLVERIKINTALSFCGGLVLPTVTSQFQFLKFNL